MRPTHYQTASDTHPHCGAARAPFRTDVAEQVTCRNCRNVLARGEAPRRPTIITKSVRFERTDCSAGTGIKSIERNTCTVNALSIAAGISYYAAHDAMADAGRPLNKGINSKLALAKLHDRFRIEHVYDRVASGKRLTLHKFLALHPVGRYYVRIRRHAFGIVDGVVRDFAPQSAQCLITDAWQITCWA